MKLYKITLQDFITNKMEIWEGFVRFIGNRDSNFQRNKQ